MCIKWWEKILLVPALIFLYLFFVDFISSNNIFISSIGQSLESGSTIQIGLGQAVGISVMRPYFSGMIKLPVYSATLGDMGPLHNIFFNFVYLLTALVIISLVAEFAGIRIPILNETKKAYKQANTKKHRRR